MTYILMIWTVVAMSGDRYGWNKSYDWRPLGEFHYYAPNGKSAKELCEQAARDLSLGANYRCVMTKDR